MQGIEITNTPKKKITHNLSHTKSLTHAHTSHVEEVLATILVVSPPCSSSSSSGKGSYCRRYSRRDPSVIRNISRIRSCWLITVETERRRKRESSASQRNSKSNSWMSYWRYWWPREWMERMDVDSLYPLAMEEKGGEQAMVPFTAKMLMMAVCSWLRISTSYKKKKTTTPHVADKQNAGKTLYD